MSSEGFWSENWIFRIEIYGSRSGDPGLRIQCADELRVWQCGGGGGGLVSAYEYLRSTRYPPPSPPSRRSFYSNSSSGPALHQLLSPLLDPTGGCRHRGSSHAAIHICTGGSSQLDLIDLEVYTGVNLILIDHNIDITAIVYFWTHTRLYSLTKMSRFVGLNSSEKSFFHL